MNPAIGILGGTFSPIHYGHLKPAEQVRKQLHLEHISLLPCHRPPHKEAPGVSSDLRAQMVKLACQEYPHFQVDLRELERDEPSYTFVTLGQMQKEMPDTPLCFLIGMDSLLAFKKWYRWEEILQRCHLVVSCRPGWVLDDTADILDVVEQRQTKDWRVLHNTKAGHIFLAEIDKQDVSSTQLRAQIAESQSTSNLVKSTSKLIPQSVAQFIAEQGLYR